MGKAKANYMSSMPHAIDSNYNMLRDYLMVDDGIYHDMARIYINAVSGMQPNINIKSNGADGGAGSSGAVEPLGTGVMHQVVRVLCWQIGTPPRLEPPRSPLPQATDLDAPEPRPALAWACTGGRPVAASKGTLDHGKWPSFGGDPAPSTPPSPL